MEWCLLSGETAQRDRCVEMEAQTLFTTRRDGAGDRLAISSLPSFPDLMDDTHCSLCTCSQLLLLLLLQPMNDLPVSRQSRDASPVSQMSLQRNDGSQCGFDQ